MKKLLFVSDIAGTITGAVEGDYDLLAKQLLLLKEEHKVDKLIFSLCTGDSDPAYLIFYYNKLEAIFNKYDITMGIQYYAEGIIEDNYFKKEWPSFKNGYMDKVQTIIEYVKKLQINDEISAVYFADDTMYSNTVNGYVES